MSAAPIPDPSMRGVRTDIVLAGEVPSAFDPPSGCRFRTRCWKARDLCAQEPPKLTKRPPARHTVACHFAEEKSEG
ncbi:MAG: oligopeptide/dipeptide ABC transporter ATP-binding protein [Nocardioidaceae bacterium]